MTNEDLGNRAIFAATSGSPSTHPPSPPALQPPLLLDRRGTGQRAVAVLFFFARLVHHINDNLKQQVQRSEGRQNDEHNEKDPGIRAFCDDIAGNVGPPFQGHHLEQREKSGAQRAEMFGRNISEQHNGNDRADIIHHQQNRRDRRPTRNRRKHAVHHPPHRGHDCHQPHQPQDAQRAQDGERARRGQQGDGDHDDVEHIPSIPEHREAHDRKFKRYFDYENRKANHIERVEQPQGFGGTSGRHRAQNGGIDQNDRDVETLKGAAVDQFCDAFHSLHHVSFCNIARIVQVHLR